MVNAYKDAGVNVEKADDDNALDWTVEALCPTGLKHWQPTGIPAQRMIVSAHLNYYRNIIDKTYRISNALDISDTDILLDIGSGLGDVAKNFSNIVKHAYCCDINQGLLNMAEINCQNRSNLSFHFVADPQFPLNFLKNTSITKAYAYGVFVHCQLDIIINYLKEIHRTLKQGGLFYFNYCVETSKPKVFVKHNENEIKDLINTLNFNIIDSNFLNRTRSKGTNSENKVKMNVLLLSKIK